MQENFIVGENRYKQKIMLNPHDLVGKGILQDGLYDKTGLYFIEKILAKLQAPVVFDIGANIGNHALRMTEKSKKVYLFEPQAKIAAHLRTTMSLNHITNWHICNYGLSDEEQSLTLYQNLDSNNGETSFVANLKGKNFVIEEAAVFVGDDIVHQYALDHLDFIKIDVEGFEAKVIAGLKHSIMKFRPIIFMEWDKEVTKEQFQDYELFETVFSDYIIKAITRNPNEMSLAQKIRGTIRQLFQKNRGKRRKIIGEFNRENDYRHIVLIPREKAHILAGL